MSRDEERQALLGVALASLPNEDEVRAAVFAGREQPPALPEALETLAALTHAQERVSHRVLSLGLLAKVAHRRGPSALDPVDAELHGFAEAAVAEADRIEPDGIEPVESSHPPATDEVARPGPEPRLAEAPPPPTDDGADPRPRLAVEALKTVGLVPAEHHWKTFARHAREPLQLTEDEVHRPLCTDEQMVVMPNGLSAVRTAVWFWSDQPAKAFQHWTDPRTWDQSCHLFFKTVAQKPGVTAATAPEFSATFTETVFVDGTTTLSTDLVFSRTVDGERLYALEFDLPPGPLPDTAAIVVDAGQVTVREDPNAPPARRTALLAEKYIRFADPAYLTWPTVACDLFWTEFAITMALGC
jgi:hypothetical protein